MTEHFIECAFSGSSLQTFLIPILETGMLVRDFAVHIRDVFKVPEDTDVILCDAEHNKPLRGMHWLTPNTALQVCLRYNLSYRLQPATLTETLTVESPQPTQLLNDISLPLNVALECFLLPNQNRACVCYGILKSDGKSVESAHAFVVENVSSQRSAELAAAEATLEKLGTERSVRFHTSLIFVCKTFQSSVFLTSASHLPTALRKHLLHSCKEHVATVLVY